MRKLFFTVLFTIGILTIINAQKKLGKHLAFCGWKYKDTAVLRVIFEKQLAFLNIKNNDTIIDIGSSSGSYEGCISVLGTFKNVTFVLVDIDSNCLNKTKVNNMVSYYSMLKGEPINQKFDIIQNTVDSLYLPLNLYSKVWLMNTLHEIPDKQKLISDVNKVMRLGGELILYEILSSPKHTIHGGCDHPLMGDNEIEILLTKNGFKRTSEVDNPSNPKKITHPSKMIRFIKI